MKNIYQLIVEAHGCVEPRVRCSFIDQQDVTYRYSVTLPDFAVTIVLPMPRFSVLIHLDLLHEAFQPDMPAEHLEAYIHDYKPRACEAISYALATYNSQPLLVRNYLQGRFGPMLKRAIALGSEWWKEANIA